MSDSPRRSVPQELTSAAAEMRGVARWLFLKTLEECSIPAAYKRYVRMAGQTLRIGKNCYWLGPGTSRTVVVAIGKAAHPMASELSNVVGSDLSGIIACPTAPDTPLPGFRYFIGGHPLPNQESLNAGAAILDLLGTLDEKALAIFLISGGASAIAEKPISDEITLADVIATYRALVHSGAPIAEINAIRKHLSALKGGRLAQAAGGATLASVLISDVPDAAPDALASGPTMPDTTTVADCYAIAHRRDLLPNLPPTVRAIFEEHRLQETPKRRDPAFQRSSCTIVLSNGIATGAVLRRARMMGFTIWTDSDCDDQDYRTAADYLLKRLDELRERSEPVCLVSGGEVTVKVTGKPGVGGRNQQFALYCAEKIAGQRVTVLSAGTDGIDGNSNAAGAVVDGTTAQRASEQGLDLSAALSNFDAFPLLHKLGDTIMTGPTGNNVRDVRILLAY